MESESQVQTSKLFLDAAVERQLFDKHGHAQQLLEAYRRCRFPPQGTDNTNNHNDANEAARELLLITGPPGVGKTGLALTLEEPTRRDGGWFCRGKFDQPTMTAVVDTTTVSSHGPFVEAIVQVANQAVQRGRICVQAQRRKLEQILDTSEIQALEESIPSLRKLTSRQLAEAPVEEHWRGLKGPEAEKRYMHIFVKLIKALGSPDHPLVILIDDLQWADRTSLELLKVLAIDQSPGLLIVCTARLQEESEEDLVSKAMDDMTTAGVALAQIKIGNMSESIVNDLVADLLELSNDKTQPLAKILHSETNGNLFFVVQLLNVLHGDGLLHVDANTGAWTWEQDSILQTLSSHQTVLDFLSKRLLQLTDFEQQLLKTASCLGGAIYECLLAETVFPVSSVRPALKTAKERGLITFDFELGSGHFFHDRIQEAAYSLVPESSRAAKHLDIGRRLWIWLRPPELDVHLFTVANQIILGLHLLDDPIEKEELATFMLRAGRKAALLSSFSMAARYFDIGINLLGRRRWKDQYNVCLALFTAAAEVEYYNGNLVRVDLLLASIFKHAKTLDDQMCARFTQIYSLGSRDDMKQALSVGLDVLKSLGETFPSVPWKVNAWLAVERCRRGLSYTSDEDIMSLKKMTDKQRLVIMRLLSTIFVIALPTKEELLPFIVVRMIEQTLQHGISAMSCVGFALLGFCLGRRGNVEDGYRFCRLGLRLMDKFQAKEWQARVALVMVGNVFTVKRPVQDLPSFLQTAHRAGLVAGDVHCSMVCASIQCRACFFTAQPLGNVVWLMEEYRKLCNQYSQQSVGLMLTHQLQVCYNLMGRSADPLILTGDVMDETETMEFLKGKHPICLVWLMFMKHMLTVYFHELQGAEDIALSLKKMKKGPVPPFVLRTHLFLKGLTAAIRSRTDAAQKRCVRRALEKLKSDKQVTFANNENKIYLLEAESAVTKGDRDTALRKYEDSIAAARREGFRHEEALANERAGMSLVEWGDQSKAREYLGSARILYREWGALAKVNQLDDYILSLTDVPLGQT